MDRRSVLIATGSALSITTAGCLAHAATLTGENDPEGPEPGDNVGNIDGNDTMIEVRPRIDEPDHEITTPGIPDDWEDTEWSDDYLGEHMDRDPSLSFEVISSRFITLREPLLTDFAHPEFVVMLLTSESELEAFVALDDIDDDTRGRIEAVDFSSSVVVFVHSGYGSGSVRHRWARIEDAQGILHLHGYYTNPMAQTADLTSRMSLIAVERPSADTTLARVSLTISDDQRVHFNSSEGVVSLEE